MDHAVITWYGHACFKIELLGSSVVLDPYGGTVPGLRQPELKADAVHVSHDHSDHNAVGWVERSGKELAFTLRTVAGCHDHHGGQHRGENKITVIEGAGLRIVHMGDQGCLLTEEQLADIGQADLVMLPIGGFYTVDAAEALELAKQLRANVVIPMHYRNGCVGYDVLDTVDSFLTGELPVEYCQQDSFVLTAGLSPRVLIPKVVQ